jgi:hypothetical protein
MKVPVPGSTVHRGSLHERYLLESDGADLVSSNVFFFPVVTRVLGSSYKKIKKIKRKRRKNTKNKKIIRKKPKNIYRMPTK